MLDPTRFALNAATVGFRIRTGQSVNWNAFHNAIQNQTDAIKVRREQQETLVSELHVMGGQRFGMEGNSKTNERARQQRQMNGYPLRSFLATGGPVILPPKHGEGLMATPMNLGRSQYSTYNAVQGQNYVSAFTEPLNAPLENNTILLGRAGIQAYSESASDPYKAVNFMNNMHSSLAQIRANQQKHLNERGFKRQYAQSKDEEQLARGATLLAEQQARINQSRNSSSQSSEPPPYGIPRTRRSGGGPPGGRPPGGGPPGDGPPGDGPPRGGPRGRRRSSRQSQEDREEPSNPPEEAEESFSYMSPDLEREIREREMAIEQAFNPQADDAPQGPPQEADDYTAPSSAQRKPVLSEEEMQRQLAQDQENDAKYSNAILKMFGADYLRDVEDISAQKNLSIYDAWLELDDRNFAAQDVQTSREDQAETMQTDESMRQNETERQISEQNARGGMGAMAVQTQVEVHLLDGDGGDVQQVEEQTLTQALDAAAAQNPTSNGISTGPIRNSIPSAGHITQQASNDPFGNSDLHNNYLLSMGGMTPDPNLKAYREEKKRKNEEERVRNNEEDRQNEALGINQYETSMRRAAREGEEILARGEKERRRNKPKEKKASSSSGTRKSSRHKN